MDLQILKLCLLSMIYGTSCFTGLSGQEQWVKYTENPALSHSAVYPNWDFIVISDPFVMLDGNTLKMWFAGSGVLSGTDSIAHVRIGYAESPDGINWDPYPGNPVLGPSPTGNWDDDGIETPTVIKNLSAPPDQRYQMWYAGSHLDTPQTDDHQIGYAFSPDGLYWTKYPGNPVLSVNQDTTGWETNFLEGPSVIQDSDTLKMWYASVDIYFNNQPTDFRGNIGYAWSLDGINWNKYAGNPVLIAGTQNNWDAASAADPHVIKVDGVYHMFYAALDSWEVESFQVGYAFSNNGIQWTKSALNPVLASRIPGEWDAFIASFPSVLFDPRDATLKMWYTGVDSENWFTQPPGEYFYDFGYAASSFTTCFDPAAYNYNSGPELNDGSCIYYGDVTMDGSIDVTDVILMTGFALGTIIPTIDEAALADVVNDNVVNIIDIVTVISWVLNG